MQAGQEEAVKVCPAFRFLTFLCPGRVGVYSTASQDVLAGPAALQAPGHVQVGQEKAVKALGLPAAGAAWSEGAGPG